MANQELISREVWERCFHHVSYDEFIARPKQRQRTFLNLPWNQERIRQDSQQLLIPVETQP